LYIIVLMAFCLTPGLSLREVSRSTCLQLSTLDGPLLNYGWNIFLSIQFIQKATSLSQAWKSRQQATQNVMTALPITEIAYAQLFTCRESKQHLWWCTTLSLCYSLHYGSHNNTRSLCLTSVRELGLCVVVILTFIFYFCSTQESTKRLTMKKLPIVVCFHFKVIVMKMWNVITFTLFKVILSYKTKVTKGVDNMYRWFEKW